MISQRTTTTTERMESPGEPQESLMSKLKDHYHSRADFKPSRWSLSLPPMIGFWIYVAALILSMQFYIIPKIWSGDFYGEWAHHIVIGGIMCNVVVNYSLCVVCRASQVRPELTGRAPRHSDGVRAIPYGWLTCPTCQVESPPRAYHCKICNSCQLRRDHHCLFTGACIALANTRRFIVLCFHMTLLGGVAFYYLLFHLNGSIPIFTAEFYLYVPPMPLISLYYGEMSWIDCLLIIQVYSTIFMTLLFGSTFVFEFIIALRGQTSYELRKNITKWRDPSWQVNLQQVFGPYWLLNFFAPMPTALEIARHWKVSPAKVW